MAPLIGRVTYHPSDPAHVGAIELKRRPARITTSTKVHNSQRTRRTWWRDVMATARVAYRTVHLAVVGVIALAKLTAAIVRLAAAIASGIVHGITWALCVIVAFALRITIAAILLFALAAFL